VVFFSDWNAARRPMFVKGSEKRGAGAMENPQKLRELAAWYREFAEKTANPSIWEARLRMAEDLEHEASRLEKRQEAALDLA
jgi:hypothetical protein